MTENYAESTATFPQKLFALMTIEEGDTVQWAPHGLAFKVINQDVFLDDIIPKYFKRKLQQRCSLSFMPYCSLTNEPTLRKLHIFRYKVD